MNRITKRTPDGRLSIGGTSWEAITSVLHRALRRLAEYEETGLTPALVCSMADESDFTAWTCEDEQNNVWMCAGCGALHRFEADGPMENGFVCCPYCGKFIILQSDEEETHEPA